MLGAARKLLSVDGMIECTPIGVDTRSGQSSRTIASWQLHETRYTTGGTVCDSPEAVREQRQRRLGTKLPSPSTPDEETREDEDEEEYFA